MIQTNVNANGTANGKPKPELSTVVVSAPTPKPEQKKENPKPEKKEQPLEARLKKLAELNKLLERREILSEALDDVNGFVHTPTAPAKIKFEDSTGRNGFSVSHPEVISEMVEVAKKRLSSELEKVDAQITFE